MAEERQIQIRRDTDANFTSEDPTLANGEVAFVTDTNEFIIGDGTTAYSSLRTSGFYILSDSERTVLTDAILHVRDEKTAGTAGGAFTSGDDTGQWGYTRTLNTEVTNTITGASLASNTITLPAGTYEIEASCPAVDCDSHQAILRDTTADSDLIIGKSSFTKDDASMMTNSYIRGRFTLSASSNLQIWHKAGTTKTTNGFGVACNLGKTEVYTEAIIRQVS